MAELVCVHLPGGAALDYALPRLTRVAKTTVLPLAPLNPAAAAVAADLGVRVEDPVSDRGDALIERVADYARAAGAQGLIGFSEFSQITVARAAERLGLLGAGPNIILARDKYRMRSAWAAAGVPNPRFRSVSSAEDVRQALAELGEPVLLKSRSSAGSVGHALVTEPAMAATAWGESQRGVDRARASGLVDPAEDADPTAMMVETVIASSTRSWYSEAGYGDYLSVEGAVVEGRYHPVAITGRLPTITPFTELSNQAPCALPEPLQRLIEDQAARAVDALGLRTCGTHTELKLLDGNRLCLLETAARLGGAMVVREIDTVFGVDLIAELARAVLGERTGLPESMLVEADRAAASVALIATDSQGRPWRRLPRFDPARIEQSGLVDPESSVEVIRAQSVPAGTQMPAYDPAAGVLNFAGLAFLQARNPAALKRDTYALLEGLEDVLAAGDHESVSFGREDVTVAEAIELFAAAGLNGPLDEPDRMQRMLDEAQELVVARTADGLLVGLIRVLTDFSFNAFVADLAVRPGWQRQGIGSRLVAAVTDDYPGVKFVVHPGHDSGAFWASLGFEAASSCVARPRHA